MLGAVAAILIFMYMTVTGFWDLLNRLQIIIVVAALIGLYFAPVIVWFTKKVTTGG